MLLWRPTIVKLPLRPDLPLIFLLVCVPAMETPDEPGAVAGIRIQLGYVWPERTAA